MSGAPLTPEQRAEMEARLATLKALKAQKDMAEQQQQQPVRMGYGYVSGDHDGEDDEHDEHDAAEEAFLSSADAFFAQQQHQQQSPSAKSGGINTTNISDIGAGSTIATTAADYAAHARELGDFELLRLAKMGDAVSFFDYAAITQADVVEFMDNQGRNSLHYAADAGSVTLIEQLRAKHVPYRTGEKGTTPLDVAVLTQQPAEVLEALKAAATESNHADGTTHSGSGYHTFHEVLERLAPAPPKFVMSKPTPTQPAPRRGDANGFWDRICQQLPTATGEGVVPAPAGVTVEVASEVPAPAEVQRLYEARNSVCGCSGWLAPMETLAAAPAVTARTVSVVAKAGEATVGSVSALNVGGAVAGAGKYKDLVPASCPLVVAHHLVVEEAHRGEAGVTDALLSTLGSALTKTVPSGNAIVAFTTPSLLREPPKSVCMLKWYRRAVNALPVFADHKLTDVVFPDFHRYDETLRADLVAKGAISEATKEKHAASLGGWACVDTADATQTSLVFDFLATKTAETGAELFFVPDSVETLREGGLLSAGVSSLVKMGGDGGAITDFVAFRLRRSANAGSAETVVVAELVYAVMTSLKATDKAEHLLLIARDVLQAHVLLVPGTFGFTESDLVKANYDELPALREFAYAVYGKDGKTVAAPAVPAAKLSLPLFLL